MWENIKARISLYAALLLALFGLGAIAVARRRQAKLEAANNQLRVLAATDTITELRAERRTLGEREAEYSDRIAQIDRELEENKREILDSHIEQGLTSEEIADEFRRLGY